MWMSACVIDYTMIFWHLKYIRFVIMNYFILTYAV